MSYRAAPLSLKAKALQLLALRDYSRAEMHIKLQRWLRTQAVKHTQPAARSTSAAACAQAAAHMGSRHPTADDTGNWHEGHEGNERHEAHDQCDGSWPSAADATVVDATVDAMDAVAAIHASDATDSPDAGSHAAAWLAQQQSQIAPVLDELQAKGWLDDRRAAEALLHQRSARLGHTRLRQALQQKGIDAETSSQLLNELAPSESERAQALWQKKFGTLPGTPAERARQVRFLSSRGFSAAIIQRILRQDLEDFD